jgi:hypothetical protein
MTQRTEDTKPFGPKTKDSKRKEEGFVKETRDLRAEPMDAEERASRSAEEVNAMCTEDAIEGANQHLHDVTEGHVFGDNTSSTGGANNPGQHGRDGGDINGEDNNPSPEDPTPEEEAPPPEGGVLETEEEARATRSGGKEESVRKL